MNLKKYYKYSTSIIILTYLLVNILFMNSFWSEIFFDKSKIGAVYGEVFAAEWGMDKLYKNIISGKNPFEYTNGVLYPFGTNLTTTDSGSAFFFPFLRPFFSTHQAFSLLTALSLFFANIGMYLLLRRLKLSKLTSFLVGLSYGYMTFLMPRLGHLTYFSIHTLPWFYYFLLSSIQLKNKILKLISALGVAFTLVWTLYLNLYFFIILALSIVVFILYFSLFKRSLLISYIKRNAPNLILVIAATLVFLYPWLSAVYEMQKFEELPSVGGWGGAIQFSSDLFGFFIPSIYSFFLGPIANFIASNFSFAYGIFENFTYPGLIIIFGYFFLVFSLLKKNISKNRLNDIWPYFSISLFFLILTLGPFLHVLGKWGITVDDQIRIVVPLPYALFHYLPLMSNIRVPGRLIVGFIFFAYIVCAFLLEVLFKRNKKRRNLLVGIFILVFIIDQYFTVINSPQHFYPNKIYQSIKDDPSQVTVMEIPSTVRDGFVYFGSGDSLGFMVGQMIHQKPVLAGYFGRIPYFKRAYYQRNPFLGYTGRLIDKDIESNGGVDKTDLGQWKEIDVERSIDSIDFLDLKYIILKDNEFFSSTLFGVLNTLGFTEQTEEGHYSLWRREPLKKEFTEVNVGSKSDDMFLGMGWAVRDPGFRWSGKKSLVLFKLLRPRDMNLYFESATFYKDQPVSIYVNKNKVGEIKLTTNLKTYRIPLDQNYFKKGINFIYFMFSKSFKPSDVVGESLDDRNLSAKFTTIRLVDQ